MLANVKYIYALDMWTVEKRPTGWYLSTSRDLPVAHLGPLHARRLFPRAADASALPRCALI
jgi:hypothetical protein